VRAFRRGLLAFLAAGVIAVAIRLRGRGGVPPQHGGWRELTADELAGTTEGATDASRA
jgi:hypothetical protein